MRSSFIALVTVFSLMCNISKCSAQSADSIHSTISSRFRVNRSCHYIIPATLITAGTITLLDKDGDEFIFNNAEVREERNENFRSFSTHIDDYLQHAPSMTTFVLSLSGVKGKHDLPNQAVIYLKSELLMLATVYSLKYTVGEGRPDTGQKNSFPSGHTAQAFVAASFLAKEYGYKSPWISVGAYAVATSVGALRMLNNRHWLSDVLVGTGIGMLSTEIVYKTHKNRWGQADKGNVVRIDPFSSFGSSGISVRYTFY